MTATLLLKQYLCVNALLVAALALFLGFRKLTLVAGIGTRHRQLITIAQALIAFSIVAPLALVFVPKESLPRIEWSILRPSPEVLQARPRAHSTRRRPVASEKITSPAESPASSLLATAKQGIPSFFLIILVAGIALATARFLANLAALRRIVRNSTLVRSLGRVRVGISDEIVIPFSVRLGGTAWIVLPARILESGGDFRLALRHELQHHRQGDTLWAIAVEVLLCAFFANPAIYAWKREIMELQEFSCDEALIALKGIPSHDYGSCLVRVAEAALGARQMHAGTTCMAAGSRNPEAFKSFLRRRVEMFPKHNQTRPPIWAGLVIGTVTAVLTIAIAFAAEQTLRGPSFSTITGGEVVVDPEIQKITDRVLTTALIREGARAGFAIVADPNTGKILAVANADTSNAPHERFWSLSEEFEPASVLKGIVAAQALDRGLVTPDEQIACENGNYRYGDRVYHDWKKDGWTYLTMEDAIALSSDIGAMKMGERLGVDGLNDMLVNFGFGPEGTARLFPRARPGTLPPAEDPKQPRTIPYVSYGTGFNATPIELVQAYGAIANGGNLMAPKTANVPDSDAQVLRRVISSDSSATIRGILRAVVTKGTGKKAESALYTTAGKTATSHYPRQMPFDGKADFAAFIGFAPVSHPRIEIFVGVRDPESKTGAHGGTHAAPVFRRLVDDILLHMKVAPDKGPM